MALEARKRLVDALEAIRALERFTDDVDLNSYLTNEVLQSAVERKFEIIGEALKKAAAAKPELQSQIPELSAVISTCNRIIHEYDAVDQLILWDTVKNDLTDLKVALERNLSDAETPS